MEVSAKQRREMLNKHMAQKIEQQLDCFSCVGHCCTYEHNSMRVTPIEAMDILDYLATNKRIDQKLIEELESCVKDFRLDKEILIGKNQELRRYYTCPFYKKEKLGCTIGKHNKPYGCLAFNPNEEKVTRPGHCGSDQSILESNALKFSEYEKAENEKLKAQHKIYWDKKDIPSALLYLIKTLKLL